MPLMVACIVFQMKCISLKLLHRCFMAFHFSTCSTEPS